MREVSAQPVTFAHRFADGLDQLVATFWPARGLRRQAYRLAAQNLAHLRTVHRSASRDRLRADWIPGGGSADADTLLELPEIRARCRDLVTNDGHAAAFVATMAANVIGTGITPQSRVDAAAIQADEPTAARIQDQIEAAWERWLPWADAAGRLHFADIQEQAFRQILTNGEVFILRQRITDDARRPYPLAVQMIEADRVDTPPDQRRNKNIRAGVELGDRGQPVAYHVRRTHPGEGTLATSPEDKRFDRIEAFDAEGRPNILHLYQQTRPGQTRGLPVLDPVLPLFKDLQDYLEAEVVAARVAACFAVFVRRPAAYEAALARSEPVAGQRRETLEPGIIEYLEEGEDISTFAPQRPGAQFDAFITRILRIIGAPAGLSYETLTKDFSKSNYSSARAALLEARRHFRGWQQWLARRLCQPLWELLIEEAYLAGDLPDVDYYEAPRDYAAVRWILPGWDWLDPQKEVNASQTSINSHLSTLADECAARGADWQANLEQAAREARYRRELGLPDPTAPATPTGQPTEPQTEEDKP
jgi:lambda family phage portal protein